MYSEAIYSENGYFERTRSLPGVDTLFCYAPRPFECRTHQHSKCLVSFLIKGQVLEVNDVGKTVETGPTTVVFTPPGMRHSHQIRTPELTTLCAGFDEEFLKGANCTELLESPAIYKSGPVITTMLRIQREIMANDKASELILKGLFLELLGEMTRTKIRRHTPGAPSWLGRALTLLRERALESLSIEEISREVGVDPSHLARVFRAYLNETPGDYVRKQRLSWAARELVRSDKPMNLIAAEAGYSDQAHFNKHFKGQIGLTPSEFRRSIRI